MNLSALTVQQLRYLVAVDRHRSFREAAGACYVSQPALSAQVKKVEDILGLCIFDRSRQPTVPTERGSRVIIQASRALEQIERIGAVAAEDESLSGTYRLGIIPTLASSLLPVFVPCFARKHPRVSLEIVEVKTDAMLRGMREGGLDGGLAVTPLDVAGIAEHRLFHEALFAYLPKGHALAERPHVRQSDLLDEQLWLLGEGHCFRTQVLALCSADRKSFHDAGQVTCDLSSFETLVGVVDAGFGVTVLPELFVRRLSPAQRERQVRPFSVPVPVREVGFLHAREHLRRAVGIEIFHILSEGIPEGLRGRDPAAMAVLSPLPRA